jgi:UDP-glucose 4-epimerase
MSRKACVFPGLFGSHAWVALAQAGHELLILDNLSNVRPT